MKKGLYLWLMIVAFFILPMSSVHAYSTTVNGYKITAYGYSEYNSDTNEMDEAFGIDGLVVEDFEDTVFTTGLSISTGHLGSNSASNWDGNGVWNSGVQGAQDIVFSVSSGASMFGVGLGQFEYYLYGTEVDLYVNNTLLVSNIYYQNGFSQWYRESQRNMYIVIEAETGEVINNVTLGMTTSPTWKYDGVNFDHVAFDPVPEPTTVLLLGMGLIGIAGAHRKRKK